MQISSWNIGLCVYVTYVALMDVSQFVNTVIWHDNTNNVAPVFCDIVIKFQVIAFMGVRSCLLIVSIRLFSMTRMRSIGGTVAQVSRTSHVVSESQLSLIL